MRKSKKERKKGKKKRKKKKRRENKGKETYLPKASPSGLLQLQLCSAVGTRLCTNLFVFSGSPLGKLGFVFIISSSSVLLHLNRFFFS